MTVKEVTGKDIECFKSLDKIIEILTLKIGLDQDSGVFLRCFGLDLI